MASRVSNGTAEGPCAHPSAMTTLYALFIHVNDVPHMLSRTEQE